MSSLGPDGTFLPEPAISDLDGATDVSAAPLWAAFRDRYTRAKGRSQNASHDQAHWAEKRPAAWLDLACCV